MWILTGLSGLLGIVTYSQWNDLRAFRATRGDVIEALYRYQRFIFSASTVSPEKLTGAQQHFRSLAAQLRGHENRIAFYSFFAAVRFVPQKKDLQQAVRCLTVLSNVSSEAPLPTEQMIAMIKLLRSSLRLAGSE